MHDPEVLVFLSATDGFYRHFNKNIQKARNWAGYIDVEMKEIGKALSQSYPGPASLKYRWRQRCSKMGTTSTQTGLTDFSSTWLSSSAAEG